MSQRSLAASVAFAFSGMTSAACAGQDGLPLVTWEAVEIVSDQAEVIARVDGAMAEAGFSPGLRMAMDDPRVDQYCTRLKLVFEPDLVECHSILQGGGTALFVVQFGGPKTSTVLDDLSCVADARIPDDAVQAFEHWQDLIIANLQRSGGDPLSLTEYVNEDRFLDYRDPSLHEAAVRLNGVVAPSFDQLAAASKACDALVRSRSVALMNYSGRPEDALDVAIGRVNDADEDVRNESLRLTSTFSAFLTPQSRAELTNTYCDLLRSPSFFDRNKSLAGLAAIVGASPDIARALAPSCLARIRTAATLSRSEQIGGYARAIIRAADQDRLPNS